MLYQVCKEWVNGALRGFYYHVPKGAVKVDESMVQSGRFITAKRQKSKYSLLSVLGAVKRTVSKFRFTKTFTLEKLDEWHI